MNLKNLTNFFFELAQLRHVKHEGWRLAGIENMDSVGEHSLRAAQIAYFLAKMEGYENPQEIVTMLVFHDIGECRVGDINKVANRYIEADEEKAVKEQLSPLEEAGEEIFNLWKQIEEKSTTAGIIAKDADLLELAFAAKKYIENGYEGAQNWIENVTNLVQTDSGKKLLEELKKSDSNEWWKGLKKF